MPQASDLLRLSDSLWLWQAYDPAVKSDLFSTAIKAKARLFLIDPIPLAPSSLQEMAAPTGAASVLVTNLNHPRAAAAFARQFECSDFRGGTGRRRILGGQRNGDCGRRKIGSGVSAIAIEGAATGEIAFHFADDGGTMVIGDALINFEPYGFALLAGEILLRPKGRCGDHSGVCSIGHSNACFSPTGRRFLRRRERGWKRFCDDCRDIGRADVSPESRMASWFQIPSMKAA